MNAIRLCLGVTALALVVPGSAHSQSAEHGMSTYARWSRGQSVHAVATEPRAEGARYFSARELRESLPRLYPAHIRADWCQGRTRQRGVVAFGNRDIVFWHSCAPGLIVFEGDLYPGTFTFSETDPSITTDSAGAAMPQAPEWRFSHESATPLDPPPWLQRDSLRRSLGYSAEFGGPINGFRADLNRDGTPDYIFRASVDACGTNCSYALVDGRTRRTVGRVGGSALVVREPMINGYPVIQAYGHGSADSGRWSISVFDGRSYVFVGGIELEGASLERLFATLQDLPVGPPP